MLLLFPHGSERNHTYLAKLECSQTGLVPLEKLEKSEVRGI
jgi:hypothetical protein